MKKILFFVSLMLLFLSSAAFGRTGKDGFDVSTGVAGPSENSALQENGSFLVKSHRSFEALVEPTGGQADFEGSIATSTKSVGFGLGYQYTNGNSNILGGLGFGASDFLFGVDALYQVESQGFSLDVSLSHPGKGVSWAVVLENVTGGLGMLRGGILFPMKPFRFELDAEYDLNSSALFLNPAMAIVGEPIHLAFGYRLPVSPGGNGSFRAALLVWIGKGFALQYLWQQRLGEHNFGLKWKF